MKGKLGSNVPMQPTIPKMPSNTSNALEALDSVNATQSNALDSISRQAAINALETTKRIASYELHSDEVLRTFNDVLNSLINIISLLPSTQPAQTERKWILCNERMPEEHEWIGTKDLGTTISDEVYVTFENPKGERFCKELNFQNGKLSAFDKSTIDAFYKGSKPIAWMPKELPEPYKGVTE